MKTNEVFLRTPYNYDRDAASVEAGLKCKDKSLAQQSMAEECDINVIVRRFGIDGQLPQGVRMPTYGDFTGINNAHEAMNAIAMAREAFDQMPAQVRARFANDVAEFVDFCSDEKNRPEAERLGLVPPKVEKPKGEAKAPVEGGGGGGSS
jgi:phage internal scaffolding protein